MATKTTPTTLTRDSYGMLHAYVWGDVYGSTPPTPGQPWQRDRELMRQASALCDRAARAGLIERAYDTISRDQKGHFEGSALHHEIYDLTIERGRVHQVLACIRKTSGSRYGVRTDAKNYVILTRVGRALELATAKKSIAAKAAKQAGTRLGAAIGIIQHGGLIANRLDLTTVYKRVGVTSAGRLVSIFDGETEYQLGAEIREATRQNHNGGIYCYQTAQAAKAWKTPDDWPGAKMDQVVLRCSAGGSYCRYDDGKISVSRLTPVEIVG